MSSGTFHHHPKIVRKFSPKKEVDTKIVHKLPPKKEVGTRNTILR